MTPEGRIKQKITTLLKSYGPACYFFMPVQIGYGKRTLDYLGSMRGWFFAIEAKASPEAKLTRLQDAVMGEIIKSNGLVFIVYDDATLRTLKSTLDVIYHGREPAPAEYGELNDKRVRQRRRETPGTPLV